LLVAMATFLFLVGASGSGKTTLAKDLLKEVEDKYEKVIRIDEVARTIMTSQGITGSMLKERIAADPAFYVDFQCDIVREHSRQEAAAEAAGAGALVLSDRSALDTIPFIHEQIPEELREEAEMRIRGMEEFQTCIQRYKSSPLSLVVLVHPFADEVEQDGTRLTPKDRSGVGFTHRFADMLEKEGIHKFISLEETDRQDRVKCVVSHLEARRVPPFPI